jgi:hypothetical protein
MMYDIMYLLFPCFPAALVSYKGRENFLLSLFFPYAFLSSEHPDRIDYFNIPSRSVNLLRLVDNLVYIKLDTHRL